jgi:hypothetical protein
MERNREYKRTDNRKGLINGKELAERERRKDFAKDLKNGEKLRITCIEQEKGADNGKEKRI